MRDICISVAIVALISVGGGCSRPVVHIDHTLPGAVPLKTPFVDRADVLSLKVLPKEKVVVGSGHGRIAVTATFPPKDALDVILRRLAQHQFNMVARKAPSLMTQRAPHKIPVQITVTRNVRDLTAPAKADDAPAGNAEPSLVRKVTLDVTFFVPPPDGGPKGTMITTRREYSSLADRRVRGDDGLGRPDDPARVPKTQTIIVEMFQDCVAQFWEMVRNHHVTADVKLRRPTLPSSDFRRAIGPIAGDEVMMGAHDEAFRRFAAMLAEDPDDRVLLFNTAVLAEKRGKLDLAAQYHRRLLELAGQKGDADAQAALGRIALVRRHTPPAEVKGPAGPID